MKSWKRWVAVVATASIVALTFAWSEENVSATVTTTSFTLSCAGIDGDNAGSLGSSKKTLDQLAAITGSSGLGLSVSVDIDAPSRIKAGSGPFNVSAALHVALPDSLIKTAKGIGITSVGVTNAVYAVNYNGAASGTLSSNAPDTVVDLNAVSTINQTLTGTVNPTGSGAVEFTPGASKLSIALNKSIGTIQIGTLSVACSGDATLATTAVLPPGSPNVDPAVINMTVKAGSVTNLSLPKYITPDDGNPVQLETLKVTKQPAAGIAGIDRTNLVYIAALNPAAQDVGLQVCAPSRLIPGKPGVNEVQTINWGEDYAGKPLNGHPLAFALDFGGQKTQRFQTSYWDLGPLFGKVPTPLDPSADGAFLNNLNSTFEPPTAAQVQSALEALPSIGAGNVNVVANGKTGYTVTFVGALANTNVPELKVTDFYSWLPADLLPKVLDALNPKPDPNVTTTTTTKPADPDTYDVLNQKLLAGTINFDQWLAGIGARAQFDLVSGIDIGALVPQFTALFPKPPAVATTTAGKAIVPDAQTGPLCTPFTVKVSISGVDDWALSAFFSRVLAAQQTRCPANTKAVTVKTVKKTRVRVNGKLVTRYVKGTKVVCQKVKTTKKK